MNAIFDFKKNSIDKQIKIIRQSFLKSLEKQEKRLVGNMAKTYFSRDMSVMALVLSNLYGMLDYSNVLSAKRPKGVLNETIVYCAHMDIIMSYIMMSSRGQGRAMQTKRLHKAYRISEYLFPEKAKRLRELFDHSLRSHLSGVDDPDLVAGFQGSIYAELFAWKEDDLNKDLSDMGYYLGKLSYLLDSYSNLDSDEKKGRYNALRQFRKSSPEVFEAYCRSSFKSLADEVLASIDVLTRDRNADIVRNIMYAGVIRRYEAFRQKSIRKKKK